MCMVCGHELGAHSGHLLNFEAIHDAALGRLMDGMNVFLEPGDEVYDAVVRRDDDPVQEEKTDRDPNATDTYLERALKILPKLSTMTKLANVKKHHSVDLHDVLHIYHSANVDTKEFVRILAVQHNIEVVLTLL